MHHVGYKFKNQCAKIIYMFSPLLASYFYTQSQNNFIVLIKTEIHILTSLNSLHSDHWLLLTTHHFINSSYSMVSSFLPSFLPSAAFYSLCVLGNFNQTKIISIQLWFFWKCLGQISVLNLNYGYVLYVVDFVNGAKCP